MIDTHCHLNDSEAFPDPGEAVREAVAAGVEKMICVGVDLESSRRAVELSNEFAEVFAVVGWHPNYAQEFSERDFADIGAMFADPKVVALGEIGLDFQWQFASRQEQMTALEHQLDFAEARGHSVVFHCREAYPELLSILELRPVRVPYLFHCFAGSIADADRAIALGAMFGVDGPVTYRKADDLRATLAHIGIERLVIETDSPWMTPHPFRSERNRPSRLPLIADGLANCLGLPLETCIEQTSRNARSWFGLP